MLTRSLLIAVGKNHTLALIKGDFVPIQFAKDGSAVDLFYWLQNNPHIRNLNDDQFRTALEGINNSN